MGSLSSQIVAREIASMKEVEEALARQVLYGADLVTNLLEVIGPGQEAALGYVLAEHYGLRPWPSGPLPQAAPELCAKVPTELATRHVFAVIGADAGRVLVATLEPLPDDVKAALEEATAAEIVEHAVPSIRIRQALARDHAAPLERRFTRLLARLDSRPDPAPSTVPPPAEGAPVVDVPRFPRAFTTELAAVTAALPRPPSAPPPARLLRWVRSARPALAKGTRRRGPFTAGDAEEAFDAATSPEDVLSTVFDFTRQFFAFTALFVVHGDLAEGRDAWGPGATREEVAGVGVPLDLQSCLSLARNRGNALALTLDPHGLDAAIAKDLRRPVTASVVVLPLTVRSRTVALLWGDDGTTDLELADVGDAWAIVSLGAQALGRIARARRRQAQQGASPQAPPATRRQTLSGFAVPHAPAPADNPRERQAEALARALAAEPSKLESAPPPSGDLPPRRTTEAFAARPATVPPPAPAPQVDSAPTAGDDTHAPEAPPAVIPEAPPSDPAPPASDGSPIIETTEAVEDDLLRAALEDLEPPSARVDEDSSSRSRVSYQAPAAPPTMRAPVSSLPSVIVALGSREEEAVERLLSSPTDDSALSDVLRLGVTAIPSLLARLPGPLSASRADLMTGKARASAASPILQALVAMRRGALPFLVVQSANVDAGTRFYATVALGELPYPETATALLARLFDPDDDVRRAATTACRALRGSADTFQLVTKGLMKTLESNLERAQRRAQAADALGAIAAPDAALALIAMLAHSEARVVAACLDALRRLTCQDFGDDQAAWQVWWRRHGAEDRALWLIDSLTHRSPELRERAALELAPLVPFELDALSSLGEAARASVQAKVRAHWEAHRGGEPRAHRSTS
ncbi:MAG: hypothetical protein IT374_10040 [Polyangiaceae bacterium]|nr:hypothetical protein [Polyangiaceae bacterium]